VGKLVWVLLEIYRSLQQRKNFANRSRTDKVIAMVRVAQFLKLPVYFLCPKGHLGQFDFFNCFFPHVCVECLLFCISKSVCEVIFLVDCWSLRTTIAVVWYIICVLIYNSQCRVYCGINRTNCMFTLLKICALNLTWTNFAESNSKLVDCADWQWRQSCMHAVCTCCAMQWVSVWRPTQCWCVVCASYSQ